MKAERVFISFIAVLVGLVAAGGAFYLYQMTKTVPDQNAQPLGITAKKSPSPTPDKANFLSIATPKDEEVFSKKQVSINGKTAPDATIIVTTEDGDQVVKPANNGDFSLSQSIPDGTTVMQITAIFGNGEEKKINKTVTYSTENF